MTHEQVRPWWWLSTDQHRRAAVLVAAIATAVLVVLLLVVLTGAATGFDLLGHQVVHGTPAGALTAVARGVTTAASSPVLYSVLAVAGWLLSPRAGRARLVEALVGLLVLATGSALRTALSVAVGRSRPPAGDWLFTATGWAFPSGHTSNVTIVAGVLVLLAARREQRRSRRVWAWAAAVLVAAAVGWSRVYLGVHWPTDVLAGWAFGMMWVAVAALIGDRITSTRVRRRRPS